MVILNQAHLRQVMKPTCEVVQKALSDRDWKSSQLREIVSWCLGAKSYNHISNHVKTEVFWPVFTDDMLNIINEKIYSDYHYTIQNSVLARLINVLQSPSIETIYAATDVEWKNDDDYVFWNPKVALPKATALMANASYVEFSMGSLDNSFQHLLHTVGFDRMVRTLCKVLRKLDIEDYLTHPHLIFSNKIETELQRSGIEKDEVYQNLLIEFDVKHKAYVENRQEVTAPVSDMMECSLEIQNIKTTYLLHLLMNEPKLELVKSVFDCLMSTYGDQQDVLLNKMGALDWVSGEFISMDVITVDRLDEPKSLWFSNWLETHNYPKNSALIMYQVLGRDEDCLDVEDEYASVSNFFAAMSPCGALLDTYYAIVDGKTREVQPLGGIYSQGQVVSWSRKADIPIACQYLFTYSNETREALRTFVDYTKRQPIKKARNVWVGNVYAVDNKHKSAELDSFVVSQLKNFQASWRMYDEFTHRKEFGLSDECFYTIPHAYVHWTITRYVGIISNDYCINTFRYIDDTKAIEYENYGYHKEVVELVTSDKNKFFKVMKAKEKFITPALHGWEEFLGDEEKYHQFVFTMHGEIFEGGCSLDEDQVAEFVLENRMHVVEQGFEVAEKVNQYFQQKMMDSR